MLNYAVDVVVSGCCCCTIRRHRGPFWLAGFSLCDVVWAFRSVSSCIFSTTNRRLLTFGLLLFCFAQINTPDGMSDYFLPLRFDVRESTNEVIVDMLDAM
jgi:hypothetical protein